MRFIETPIFTREISTFMTDEEYHSLQLALLFRPEQGAVISGGGGLRKLRWGFHGKGKRGGCRIIYYWDQEDTIYMLFVYPKSKQEDLTPAQVKLLAKLVQEEFK
jgi:hypothetical protein